MSNRDRVRRTDDGTYPDVAEERAKMEERAAASRTRKPHEETWRTHAPADQSLAIWLDNDRPSGPILRGAGFDVPATRPMIDARMKLAACAPEMARMLLDLEAHTTHEETVCASCGGPQRFEAAAAMGRPNFDHTSTCALDALLRKAGVR